ncbi:MAG: hypothetical protein JWL74_1723 [Alphaproteobacteria bacterium]|nr:hypothetical protein [Alphaproteobacteria bacterium]
MLSAVPQAQRDAPFLESGAEILGTVDRVDDRDPPVPGAGWGSRGEAFLSDDGQVREAFGEPGRKTPLEQHISLGDRASVGFPPGVETPFEKVGQGLLDERFDRLQQGGDVGGHAARSIRR